MAAPLSNLDTVHPTANTAATSVETSPALQPKRLRLWIFCCIAFVVLAPTVSTIIGLKIHAGHLSYEGTKQTYFPGRTISFEAVLIAADPKTGTMTLDWTIIEERNSLCSKDNLSACQDVNIFFDNNLLKAEGSYSQSDDVLSSDIPKRPIFRLNATALAIGDVYANSPTFRTQLALFSPGDQHSNLMYYPFDTYTSEILFFGKEISTNATVGVTLGRTRGIAVGFQTSVAPQQKIYVPPDVVDVIVTLKRSSLVRSYGIISTVAIWMITIILLLVMITTVFFGFKQRGEVLLIPVATLFAFTQLRQTMPGAPEGFGDILDFVALLPCLALLSLSAAFTLAMFILTDPTETPNELRWELIYEAFPVLKPKTRKSNV